MSLPAGVRRAPTALLSVLAVLATGLVAAAPAQAAASELFFSEYIEGSSNNKALEIYNGTDRPINLGTAGYSVQMFFNGAVTAGLTIDLTGTVASGDVYVVAQASANATILAQADQTSGAGWFNGDDAITLRKSGIVIDSIGQAGLDPGTEWGSGLTSTADNTLRRKAAVAAGDTNANDVFDPAVQWDGFATDTIGGLGAHGSPPGDPAPSVTGTSPSTGATNVPVGSNLTVTFSEDVVLADGAIALACAGTNRAVTVTGGPTTYTADPVNDLPTNATCTATVDDLGVADSDTQDPPNFLAADFTWSFSTPAPLPSCDDPQTDLISQVQGPGALSPVVGTAVTVEAVVTAIRPSLQGFFIQEEAADEDGSPATSEGIFVRTGSTSPPAGIAEGDKVQVAGGVREFTSNTGAGSSQTQISASVSFLDCGVGALPPVAVLELPVATLSDFEQVEGMRVTMPQALVISEYFNFGRFNETVVGLPPNGRDRFDTPTAVQEPNVATNKALLALYARSRITVDDGRSSQNTTPPIFPGMVTAPFTLANTFRGGDTLTGITGVVEHTFGLYRVHPTTDATYTAVNHRSNTPPVVGGELKVASFNVLNYFLTLDNGQNVCGGNANLECRGADANQPDEFSRQRTKIVDAISRLDADVVGLMELENTPGVNPTADLVAGLNAATAPGTYDYIDTGVIGTDAIRLGFLYQPRNVTPVGDFKVLDSSVDPDFIDTRSRPALAQTFQQAGTTERVTVAVNHLKSKGSGCGAADPDTGDGSGNCNITRTMAARALAKWLATDPTGSGDADNLIIGDLNSYDHEDPIDALKSAGYTDLVKQFSGEYAYGYVFDGMVGYLDHGLANTSLVRQVTGAAEWHLNADEPTILDYDTSFKAAAEDALYEPNAFRSSDHDAVLIGLDLGRCSFTDDPVTKVRTLDGDCSTNVTVRVPDGWTLDGAGHTITAYDGPDEHFLGAVVANDGAVAHVRNLTVTAYELADVCDAGDNRLRGIMLDGASGSVIGAKVLGVEQGASGCQEGNGIEVRNAPFDTTGVDTVVTVSGNEVRNYQKGGIVANGSVNVTILGNTVQGVGPVDYIAQNGVQIAFGATGVVESNSIADNFYTGHDVACGLLFFEADGVKQKRNTFAGNERDVCNFGRGGSASK